MKKGISIGAIIVIIIAVVMIGGNLIIQDKVIDNSHNDEKSISETLSEFIQPRELDTEEKILEFIKTYQGKDDEGDTLLQAFEKSIIASHTGEDIFESPVTTVSFFATKDYSKEISDRYWKVGLELHTYRDDSYYEWMIDTETNSVYAGNKEGRSILNSLR